MGSGHRANFTLRRYIQSHNDFEAQCQKLSKNNPNDDDDDDDDDQSMLTLFSARRHAQPLQTKCILLLSPPTRASSCHVRVLRNPQRSKLTSFVA